MSRTVAQFDCASCGQHNEDRRVTWPRVDDRPGRVAITTCGWCQQVLFEDDEFRFEEL